MAWLRSNLDRLLEQQATYELTQRLTQFGSADLQRLFREYVDDREYDSVLELGCGTGRWPVTRFRRFVRTDINARYFPRAASPGVEYRLVDATNLSCFEDSSFDLVYSFGLYHHLPDEAVLASLKESHRLVAGRGRVVVFDAILPTRRFNLLGQVLRALDRGQWIRSLAHSSSLMTRAGLMPARMSHCMWGPLLEGCYFDLKCSTPAPRSASPC